jgi:signal transduction histidine kinase
MDFTVPAIPPGELAAAFFQALITTGLAVLFTVLLFRYRKAHFAYWTLAWTMYSVRLASILSFLLTENRVWLYWHQVTTGWTALALLWAAMVFALQVRWRRRYWALVLFPPVWSFLAIYRMDNFMLAAWPAVAFLSLATLWTGGVFFRYARTVGSGPGYFLAATLLLWGVHDLDYPLLRAMGAWNPWGYYLDLLFELSVAAGLLLVVLEDQRRGLEVFSRLSGDLQESARGGEVLEQLVARPLALPGVQGCAIFRMEESVEEFVHGAGICGDWGGGSPSQSVGEALDRALQLAEPHLVRAGAVLGSRDRGYSYVLAVPVLRGDEVWGALVVVGNARDPLAALDGRVLLALGRQVGAALESSDVYRQRERRKGELELLASRMVRLHEEERRRLSRELHDETAQVFAAVSLELGSLGESVPAEITPRLDRARTLVRTGIDSIRNLTRGLRPTLLDDLGLLPALKALIAQFQGSGALKVTLDAPPSLPELPKESELALFRALQEGLANVGRHAEAKRVEVLVQASEGWIRMEVWDDGRGLGSGADDPLGAGRMGLAGMRERLASLGGRARLEDAPGGGAVLTVELPIGN